MHSAELDKFKTDNKRGFFFFLLGGVIALCLEGREAVSRHLNEEGRANVMAVYSRQSRLKQGNNECVFQLRTCKESKLSPAFDSHASLYLNCERELFSLKNTHYPTRNCVHPQKKTVAKRVSLRVASA